MDPQDFDVEDQVVEEPEEGGEAETADETPPTGDDTPSVGGEPSNDGSSAQPTGKARAKARAKGFHRTIREKDAQILGLQQQIIELQRSQTEALNRIADGNKAVADAVGRANQPPKESPIVRARKRLEAAARGINNDDPKTVENFLNEQATVIAETAQELTNEAVSPLKEEISKLQSSQPTQQSAQMSQFLAMAPWLEEDEPARKAVVAEVQRIVRAAERTGNPRNMKNPTVYARTVKQAIVKVAQDWDLDVEGATAAEPANANPTRGTGSRAFSSTDNGEPDFQLSPFQRSLADKTPGFNTMPKEKRYEAYKKMLLKEASSGRR